MAKSLPPWKKGNPKGKGKTVAHLKRLGKPDIQAAAKRRMKRK